MIRHGGSRSGSAGPFRPRRTNDYSVNPRFVGGRVDLGELDEVVAICDGTKVARHRRCLAKHQTLILAEHMRVLRAMRVEAALAARPAAVERLAERSRAEEWTHAEFLAACLDREVAARQANGGEMRIRAARYPARKTLEEFDSTTNDP